MKNKVDWDVVVVVTLGAVTMSVLVLGLVHGVGMKPIDGLRLVMYTTGITVTP